MVPDQKNGRLHAPNELKEGDEMSEELDLDEEWDWRAIRLHFSRTKEATHYGQVDVMVPARLVDRVRWNSHLGKSLAKSVEARGLVEWPSDMPEAGVGASAFVGVNEVSEDDVVCGCWLDSGGDWGIGICQPAEDPDNSRVDRFFAIRDKRRRNKCPDCGCRYEYKHKSGCAVERCSMCGGQQILCRCPDHDPEKTRWFGALPKTD